MTGNIIGEPIDGYVQQQIALRQFSQFGGYEYPRTSPEFQYLTNRNAWVKLASSVEITDAGLKKLTNINIENVKNFLGTGLAKKAILFNTLSEYTNSSSPLASKRANVTNVYVDGIAGNTLWNDNFAYGIGGKDFGLQPPPGIIGVTVDSLNRGSIRKANINLKAHNRFQFDILELLYLRLGFTMMLEWGWDKYLSLEEGIVSLGDVGNTIIEEKWFESTGYSQISMLNLIQSYRVKYSGNYDGFFGKVSNFTWNYNSDGTYDIAIDLITIGDVIESLKVNASSKIVASTTGSVESTTEPQEAANNITQASYLNTVGYFLYRKAIEVGTAEIGGSEFRAKENKTLSFSPAQGQVDSFIKDGQYNYLAINPSKQVGERTNAKGNQSIQFYVRLKEFFSQLESLVIPRIDNNLQLKFELESCLMTHFPNQISFDPKICVFKYPMGYGDIPVAQGEGTEGILNPASIDARNKPNYLSNLADYQVKKGDYIYGDLMNIYVNFEYISGLLLQNGGPDQDLFLFKFLQDLCNGINNALGGVNKLEPIIKDDYIITIIDQTFSSAADNSVDLNVYGYDTDTKTSNFVKDIKFTSKITPGLASTITIGATAGGSSTSEIDGTAFSKWSEGLVDRFSRTVAEPTGVKTLEDQNAAENEELRELRYEAEWENNFYDANTTVKSTYADIRLAVNTFFGTENRTDNFFGTSAVEFRNEVTEQERASGFVKRKLVPPGSKYGGLIGKEGGVSLEEFKIFARAQEEDEKRRNILQVEELQDLVCTDYYFYLINAFGGKSNNYNIPYPNTSNRGKTIPIPYEKSSSSARYLEYNDTFISQGKAAYKNYLNMLNNRRYGETNIPSSEIGFIPLSFDLTLDGISGVKIYNKLNINNNFLPSNYPESLKFVITKVNHSISNAGWETSLSTVSIPKTSEYKFGEFVTIPTLTNTGGSGNDGGPEEIDGIRRVSLTTGIPLDAPNLSSAYKARVIYRPIETKKTMIVLHHTAGGLGIEGTISGWTKSTSDPVSTHYIIDRDGNVEQLYDEKYYGYHASVNTISQASIGVELVSFGTLKNKNGKWYYWAPNGEDKRPTYNSLLPDQSSAVPMVGKDGKPITKPYRGFTHFQGYSTKQIASLEALINKWKSKEDWQGSKTDHKLNLKFNYDDLFPGMGQDDIVTSSNALNLVPGVYSHCSTTKEKLDLLPQKELIDMLKRVLDQ